MRVSGWKAAARRAVLGLGVEAGELILVLDHAGRPDVSEEFLLAIGRVGATPLYDLVSPTHLGRLIRQSDAAKLARWDSQRVAWVRAAHRSLALVGDDWLQSGLRRDRVAAWRAARSRCAKAEDALRLPGMAIAVPTAARANRMGIPLSELDGLVLRALNATSQELQSAIDPVSRHVRGSGRLTICSGQEDELELRVDGRTLHIDDGMVDERDRQVGGQVSNLPAGSIYTTVVEEATEGSVRVHAGQQFGALRLRFRGGRIVDIDGMAARAFERFLDSHGGEPRRVGHAGIGLNPRIRRSIGWTIVDEHVYGSAFLSLGENRYMGGMNESTLNLDLIVERPTVVADGRLVKT